MHQARKLYLFLFSACAVAYVWLFSTKYGNSVIGESVTLCPFKLVTGLPCPSCGSTRSMHCLIDGNISESIQTNPLGIVLAVAMLVIPFWIIYDWVSNKKSAFFAFRKMESLFRKPIIYLPFILLIMANWIWNIEKGL
ncbi:DUF2752 domain-containing protein [Sphingobacterium hungaricum]